MNEISLFPIYKGHEVNMDDFMFSYDYENENRPLVSSIEGFNICLDDDSGCWNPRLYNLKIKRTIRINNANLLFGSGPDAIAAKAAEIGVAILWSSKSSEQRGAFKIGQILNVQHPQEITLDVEFGKSAMRGQIELRTILYISKADEQVDNKSIIFANTQGMIVGELDKWTVIIDGDASIFPIFFAELGNRSPLWELAYNSTDPSSDDFCENVAIHINKNHHLSEFLDRNNPNYNKDLFRELISNAVGLLIETVRYDDPGLACLEQAEDGSVASVIKYFRDCLEWNLETPQSTSISIRKKFEQSIR